MRERTPQNTHIMSQKVTFLYELLLIIASAMSAISTLISFRHQFIYNIAAAAEHHRIINVHFSNTRERTPQK